MLKKETTKTENTTEYMKCEFTKEEMEKMSADLANKVKDHAQAEAHKKEITAKLALEVSTIGTQIQVLAQHVSDRYEHREIKCTTTFDYEHGVVTMVRNDTGTQVSERSMTDDEKQMGFKL